MLVQPLSASFVYLLVFLAGVALLGTVILTGLPLPGRGAVLSTPPVGLQLGTYLSLWGLSALCLYQAFSYWLGYAPLPLPIHMGITAGGLGMSVGVGNLLLTSLGPSPALEQVGMVTSPFIPVQGSGLRGRVRFRQTHLEAVCPSLAQQQPTRRDKVRCVGCTPQGENLVLLRHSTDEVYWYKNHKAGR